VWNTSHLLQRSIHTYLQQDIDPATWELIVIDDNSQDDVAGTVAMLNGKINIRTIRLNHQFGMRGNTVSFNTAFGMARGHILAETTAECLLPKDGIRKLLEPHRADDRCFVALKTYNLTREIQRAIDTVNWQEDIMAVSTLPGWNSPWVQNNVANMNFGTHQICSIRKDVFYQIASHGFPLFGDYGSEDPWYAGRRERHSVRGVTLPNDCMAIHQWHPPFQYWMAKGRGPLLNKFAHSMSNYLEDRSGEVPDGGTCTIWDGGSHERLSDAEKDQWKAMDADVLATGVSPALLI
jgi:glycosyltransferase involved in cell wall biosynthesis